MQDRRGQSTAEYAILIGVVIAAAIGMQLFWNRGLKAKWFNVMEHYTQETGGGVLQNPISQYEPYYNVSKFDVNQNRKSSDEYQLGGAVARTGIEETTRRTGFSSSEVDVKQDDGWQKAQ